MPAAKPHISPKKYFTKHPVIAVIIAAIIIFTLISIFSYLLVRVLCVVPGADSGLPHTTQKRRFSKHVVLAHHAQDTALLCLLFAL